MFSSLNIIFVVVVVYMEKWKKARDEPLKNVDKMLKKRVYKVNNFLDELLGFLILLKKIL
ncbi:MAG: hypothetical protein A2687_03655 [Candidatus Levybacteria bacterium RIFCSPHIGHO2_01_FULL_38_26]|nr:MAG: hypothetical protein A2687_03655 [Candidatus Levybacteria bacterium RIFCSPHIGHO2_01_FULL_38_26]